VALVIICGHAGECVTVGDCDAGAIESNYCEVLHRHLGDLVLHTQVHFQDSLIRKNVINV